MIDDFKENMFYGAGPEIFKNAQILRQNQTKAEEILWLALSGKNLGVKFRRQHAIAKYVVDFYCHECKLIIEIDGEYHNTESQQKSDIFRSTELEQLNLKVVRFTNEEIYKDLNIVLSKIKKLIIESH